MWHLPELLVLEKFLVLYILKTMYLHSSLTPSLKLILLFTCKFTSTIILHWNYRGNHWSYEERNMKELHFFLQNWLTDVLDHMLDPTYSHCCSSIHSAIPGLSTVSCLWTFPMCESGINLQIAHVQGTHANHLNDS